MIYEPTVDDYATWSSNDDDIAIQIACRKKESLEHNEV